MIEEQRPEWRFRTGDEVLDTLWHSYKAERKGGDDYTFEVDGCSVRVFGLERVGNDWSGIVLLAKGNNIYKDRLTFVRAWDRKSLCARAREAIGSALPNLDTFLMELDHALRRRMLYETSGLQAISVAELSEYEIPQPRTVIESLAVAAELTLLVGEGGVGKTARALVMAWCAAGGIPFLGMKVPEPLKVLYLNLEMSTYEFMLRMERLKECFPRAAQKNFYFTTIKHFDISSPADQRTLEAALEGISLLVVDNHSWWHGSLDENDNTEMMNGVVIPILAIAARQDCAVVLLHHTPWTGQRPRGAVGLYNAASICVLLTPNEQQEFHATMTFKKWRTAAQVKPKPIDTIYDPETFLISAGLPDYAEILDFPIERAKAARQLAEARGIRVTSAYRIIKNLLEQGSIKEKNGTLYSTWQFK